MAKIFGGVLFGITITVAIEVYIFKIVVKIVS